MKRIPTGARWANVRLEEGFVTLKAGEKPIMYEDAI
jgi:hypothetical protein